MTSYIVIEKKKSNLRVEFEGLQGTTDIYTTYWITQGEASVYKPFKPFYCIFL